MEITLRSVGFTGLQEPFRGKRLGCWSSSSRSHLKRSSLDCRSFARDDAASSSNSGRGSPVVAGAFLSRQAALLSLLAVPSVLSAPLSRALQLPSIAPKDEFDQEEDSLIELFVTATRSVVSVQNVQILGIRVVGKPVAKDDDVKVEGIGSGFIWDKFGYIVCLLNSLHVCIVYFSVRVLENSW